MHSYIKATDGTYTVVCNIPSGQTTIVKAALAEADAQALVSYLNGGQAPS